MADLMQQNDSDSGQRQSNAKSDETTAAALSRY
jgi:hypothetical protein